MRRQGNKRNGPKARLFSTSQRLNRGGLWHHELAIEPLEHRHLLAATVTSTTPSLVGDPDLPAGTKSLKVVFSEPVANATLGGNYELLGSGGDGNFDSGNEVAVAVTATYAGSTNTASLTFATLPVDHYRFSINSAAITDLVGSPLDGDGDGTAGGDFAAPFEIVPGEATKLTVTGFPTSPSAGAPGSITVTVLDAFNNVATGYTGTLRFTSTDTQATLPADYTFSASDNGTRAFPVTLFTAGTRSITATDTTTGFFNKQQGITVTPAAASTFVVSGFIDTSAGASKSFSITANDAYGNKDTSYTGTVRITSSDPQATLPADYTFTLADAGRKSLSATLRTAGSQSLTATDITLGFAGTQSGILVSPLATTRFVTSGFPSPATTGVPGTFTVVAVDTYGNTTPNYAGTVRFTSTDAMALLPADYSFAASDAGVRTFSATLYTLGSKTITATDIASGSIFGSQAAISVVPDAPANIRVSLLPTSTTAGQAQNFKIDIRDAHGNVVPSYTGLVQFTSSDPLAVLPADYSMTAADGGNRTFSVTFKTAGTQSITATATDSAGAVITGSGSTNVVATIAKTLSVSGFTTPTAASSPGTFTVTARDAYGNQATSYAGTVNFTSTDPAASLPPSFTFTPSDLGSATFSATLLTAGTRSITVTDSSDATILGKQQGIVVTPAAASTFMLSGLASASAGTAQSFVLTTYDAFGNKNTGYTGTVHFTSTDPLATLPADYTFTAADAGDNTFSATLRTAGGQSLTVTDTALGFSSSQTGIAISPLAASRFVTSGFPSPTLAGAPGVFSVAAVDTYGNAVPTYAGTVHFTSTDPLAVLPADYTFTAADAGVKSFSATLLSMGSKTIAATDTTSGISGSQSSISVQAGVASRFEASMPSAVTAGAAQNFTLYVRDALGNLVTGYSGVVRFVSSDPLAVLPADYTFTSADGGDRSFSVTFKTAGPQTITAIATADATLTGGASTSVYAAGVKTFSVTGYATPSLAGTPGTFTVAARDAYGNPVLNYTGTVLFTSTDLSAILPASYTFKPSDQGSATFSATLVSAGTRTITVTDIADSTVLGKQQGIVVTAGAASYMVIDAPTTVSAGSPFAVTVTAKDAHGNLATGYTGTIHFDTPLDDNSTLPPDYTFTAADAGTRVFTVTMQASGSQSIDVIDTHDATITGHQGAIRVLAPQYRYAASSNNIYVTGPVTVTLTEIKAALPSAPLQLVDPVNGVWMLKANLVMNDGAKLLLHGTSIGGDVNELRLKSNNVVELNGTGKPNNFVFVQAFYGTLDINTTKITSWNEAANGGLGGPDTETDVFRRAFIRVLSYEENGIAYESRMDVKNSDIGYLGSHDAEAYGLTWKVRGGTPELIEAGDFTIYDRVDVYGDVLNNKLHHNYFAIYTFGAYGMLIDNNKVYNNIGYGIDPHDDSDYLVISNNESYNNGWHGIIASQRCDHIQIINNISRDNGKHGIMLHRGSDYGLIANNITYNNGEHGIALFNNFYTEVRDNVVYNNLAGIRLSVGSGFNSIHDNLVYNNIESGIKFFQGSDLPSDGEEYVDATGRPTANTFERNTVLGNGRAIELSDADLNVFRNNTFGDYVTTTPLGTTVRPSGDMVLTDAVDNVFQDNTIAPSIVLSTRSESGEFASKSRVIGSAGMYVKVDATSSVYFDDPAGKVFDVLLPGIGTTVVGADSKLSLAAAQIGNQIVQVLPRNLTATTGAAQALNVDVTEWTTTGNYRKVWLAQSGAIAQVATYTAGDLAANKPYAILKNGVLLRVAQSDATGKLSFSDVAGTTSPVAYSVVASVTQFFVSSNLNVTAGISQALTVQYSPASGIGAANYRGKIHFTSDDPEAELPDDYTFRASDAGQRTFSVQFKTAGPHTVTVTEIANPTITGSSLPTLVAPAAAASFSVLGYTQPIVAGTPGTFKVIAKDPFDNIATDYLGTVGFTASSAATLPPNYTFTALDQGVHYFPATFTTAGTKSITVIDTVTASITGTQVGIIVGQAPVAGFVATGLTSSTAGTSVSVTIRAVDALGNTVTSNTTRVHFSSTDPLAVLPSDYTFSTNDAGVRTFSVQYRTAGTQTLTVNLVSDPTIRLVLPATIVSPAAASTLSVTGFPTAIHVGVPGAFTVTAKDAYGNIARNYLGTATFSGTSAVTLPANYKFTTADQGVRTFTATYTTTGTKSLTARDTVTSSISGTQSGIVVSATPVASLAVTGTSSVTAGGNVSVTVQARDANGNTITSFTGRVHFTSTDPQAILPSDYTFLASDNGVRTFNVPLRTAGAQSISVNIVGTPAIVGTLSNIAVAPAATSKFTVSGLPNPTTAGAVVPINVTARDQYNNITPAYRGTIRFTSNDSQAVLPGNYAYSAADNGQHTFNVTLKTSGSRSVTATSTVTSSINGSQSVTVNAAQATVLRVYNFPNTVTAGQANTFTVRFYDAYGNTATGYVGTVTFSSNDPLATLPATYTFTAANAGRRDFTATLRSIGTNRTITATEVGGAGLTGTQTSIRVR